MTYSAEVLADSPLAYWRLGEPSGTTTSDSSGNGRNGTYAGGVTLGTTGLLTGDADTAATFNGTTGAVGVTNAAWMDTGTAMTIEAWINTSATGFREIAALYTSAGARAWEFRIDSTTGFLVFIKLSGGTTTSTGTSSIRDGARHHVVATYDGTNIRLYVDGSLQTTTAATGSITSAGSNFGIAERASDQWFSGVIDEVAWYGTALSGARVTAHYTAGTSQSQTVTPPAATATATAIAPTVTGAGLAVPAATATAAAIAPVVSADSSVTPPVATATAMAPVPVIEVPGDQTVLAPTATATATAIAPALTWGASVAAPAATASAEAIAPVVSGTASATVAPPVATATATAIAPFISSDSPDATIDAPTATATATAHAPVFVGVYSSGTDTTNLSGGRIREATGAVTITRPVEAVPVSVGTRVDKALAYPTPTMVDGRPT